MPTYSFTVNGEPHTVEAPEDLPMLWVLRDMLNITGPKYGCGIGDCRACTCHMDGEAFTPCVWPVSALDGKEITTIEGLAATYPGDGLHPVQEAWLEVDPPQCGFCQPGQIMAAADLIARNPNPTDDDIDGLQNVCRCGTYIRIRQAIKVAAANMATGIPAPATGQLPDTTTAPATEPLPATGGGVVAAAAGLMAAAAAVKKGASGHAADEMESGGCTNGECTGACHDAERHD